MAWRVGLLAVTSGAVRVTNSARVARLGDRWHHVRVIRSWHSGVKLAAAFLLVAVFFATQNALVHVSRGQPIDWQWDVLHELVYWLVWAAYAPAVLAAARRWPVTHGGGWPPVARHLGLMAVLAPVQIASAYGVHCVVLLASGVLPMAGAGAWLAARGPGVVWGTFAGFLYYWVIAAVFWAAQYQQLFRAEREQALELEASLSAARLDALKAQLQPHFLFNTLNAIAVLTADDPLRARQMIVRLSDLLRRSMASGEGTSHEVPLSAELDLLEAYIGIERARFAERLSVRQEIEPGVREALVPTLLLQPLVENAIRHGLEEGTGEILIRARRQEESLVIVVRDNGRGLVGEERDGIGLANTRERLAWLYHGRARLDLRAGPDVGVVVEVTLPFHTTP